MAKIELELDATELIKAFNAGVELGFILANDTPELESELNKNNIDIANGD